MTPFRRSLSTSHHSASRCAGPAAAVLAPLLIATTLISPARAINVTVNGTTYDIELFNGSYDGSPSLFATPANGGLMPWWGDSLLADEFAVQLGAGLSPSPLPSIGPLFAHTDAAGSVVASSLDLSSIGISNVVDSSYTVATSSIETYAKLVGSPAPSASVPAPLPILGGLAAFHSSRRLRQRRLLSNTPGSAATTPAGAPSSLS